MKKHTMSMFAAALLTACGQAGAQELQPMFVVETDGPTSGAHLRQIKFTNGFEFRDFIFASDVTDFRHSGTASATRIISATDKGKRHRAGDADGDPSDVSQVDAEAFAEHILAAFQDTDLNHFLDNNGSNPEFSFVVHFNRPIKDNEPGQIDEIGEIIFFERGANTANSFIVLDPLDENGNQIGKTVLVSPDEPVSTMPRAQIGVYRNDMSYAGWHQEMGGVSVDLDRFGVESLQHIRVRSARIGRDGLTSEMVSGMGRDLNPDFKLIAVQTYEVELPWWAIGD
jgi:hypothetical protein